MIERKVTEGQVVQPADGVFLVADLSNLWVVADVPEQIAGAVRVGESVLVEVAQLESAVLGRLGARVVRDFIERNVLPRPARPATWVSNWNVRSPARKSAWCSAMSA